MLHHRAISIFRRRHAHHFLKLPHKVYIVLIPALFSDMANGEGSGAEQLFCIFDPGMYDVSHACNAKVFFIQMLKVRGAEANLVR